MLYMHQRGEVIGSWENIEIAKHQVTATPVFDEGDEKALLLKGKVERGHLRAASVSLGYEYNMKDGVIFDAEVLETSLVDVPSYRNTLMNDVGKNILYYNPINGLELEKMEEKAEKETKEDAKKVSELTEENRLLKAAFEKKEPKEDTKEVSELTEENRLLKAAFVQRFLSEEGAEKDELRAKAYSSLPVTDLLALKATGIKKEGGKQPDDSEKRLDANVIKGIESLAAVLGGQHQGDKDKGYHNYTTEELQTMEETDPKRFNELLNNYTAKK